MWVKRICLRAGALALLASCTAAVAGGQPLHSATQTPARGALPAPLMGAAWYPEQWPESRWDADLTLMQAAGIHVVRVGEFAWSTMEPREGAFHFDWLARAIRLAAKHHIFVVLGTPTDAPPAWLTRKYPDTLRVDAEGRRARHGGRRQFSYSSPRYRVFCRKIAGEMAERFGHNPDVIGWQIGNEYREESYDPSARKQWHRWLQAKYGTLEALNRRWTTVYWSQTYDRWDEIPLHDAGGNPGLRLDHRRFVTATWRDFQRVQIDAIRHYADPRQFITTNIGGLGWADHFDHYAIARVLSFAAWDDYAGGKPLDPVRNGFMNDFVRGWKRRNFWVMETQPGSVNWAPVNRSLSAGEVRAMAWQDVGHGADAVLYWQWRDALNGQETYHGAMVGPDGKPLPVYPEIQRIGKEFERAAPAIEGTVPKSQVAIVLTYPSRWAIDFQPFSQRYDQLQVLLAYYEPLERVAQSVDVVEATAPLDGYKLVLAPSLNVISPELAAHLLAYVRRGGHLLLGPRSGMKDQYNRVNTERQPGPLVAALGGRVEQYYALARPVSLDGFFGRGWGKIWGERLSVTAADTKVPIRYVESANGWLNSRPAMIERGVGKGTIAYLGTLLDRGSMRSVIGRMANEAGVEPVFGSLPGGVEAERRVASNREILILINFGAQPARVLLRRPMRRIVSDRAGEDGQRSTSPLDLAPLGVAVLEAPLSR